MIKNGDKGYGSVSYWLNEISRAQKSADMARWADRCKNIRIKYRDDESKERRIRQYAILWSNMETIKPAVYAKPPKAVVQRRYRDSDPVGRIATEILERAINFTFEANDFDSRIQQVRDDYLLYGRGVARIFYEPVMVTVPDDDDSSGLDVESVEGPQARVTEETREAGEVGNPGEVLDFEHVKVRYVQRHDFVHQAGRTWDEVDWVAFRGYLDRDGLIERFGEKIGKQLPLSALEHEALDLYRFARDESLDNVKQCCLATSFFRRRDRETRRA